MAELPAFNRMVGGSSPSGSIGDVMENCERCEKLEKFIKKWHFEQYWGKLCMLTAMYKRMGYLSPRLSWKEWLDREIN